MPKALPGMPGVKVPPKKIEPIPEIPLVKPLPGTVRNILATTPPVLLPKPLHVNVQTAKNLLDNENIEKKPSGEITPKSASDPKTPNFQTSKFGKGGDVDGISHPDLSDISEPDKAKSINEKS